MRPPRIAAAFVLAVAVIVPVVVSTPAGAATLTPPIAHAATCVSTSADQTSALNAWLANSVPNGSIVQFASGQCYHLEGPVVFGAKTNVTFDGNGSTFQSFDDASGARTDDHLTVRGNLDVVVANLHIVGAATAGGYHSTLEAQHGIYILGNNGVTVDNVTVDHVFGDFVALQQVNGNTPNAITIENSDFGLSSTGDNGAGRQEMSIDDGTNVYVTGNYFGHGSRSGVDIEPTSSGAIVQSITFDANTFGPNNLMWFANAGANATITGVWFTNNTLNRAMNADSLVPAANLPDINNPASFRRTDYEFFNNTSTAANGVSNCTAPPTDQRQMRFIGVNGLLVEANTQPMVVNRCQYLVRADTVINGQVSDNNLVNAASVGYYSNSVLCEAGNRDGNPLHAAAISPGATAC